MRKKILIVLSFLLFLPTFLFTQTPEQMSQLYEYIGNKNNKAIIAFSHDILDKDPGNNYMMYVLAWAFAMENNVDSSLTWIEKSIIHGNTDYLEFKRDSDFKVVHSHPKFNELMELGKLQAIKKNEEKAIHLKASEWNNFRLESQYDLPKIDMSLSFDHENFYIKAIVNDVHFKDGNRAWRYGDGFFINISNPVDFDSVYTDRFYAYGFCLENGKPSAVLVNKDGIYYLGSVPELTPKIDVDQEKNQAKYFITIPWFRLYPFHPLMHHKGGINIRYTSQNDDRSRKRLQYMEDNHFDSESTKLRRYVPLYFEQSPKSALHITGKLKTRLISSDHVTVKIATWAPEDFSAKFTVTIKDKDENKVLETTFTQKLSSCRSLFDRELKLPKTEGFYQLQISLDKKVRWNDSFFKFDQSALAKMKSGIQQLAKGEPNLVLSNSIDALTYRFTELKKQITGFTDRDNPEDVQKNMETLNSLYQICRQSGSIYTKSGYLLSAFKSPLDSTLQPFSIHLPDNFNPSKSYDLLVGLHGSGVDEVGFLRWTARTYADKDIIIIGPRGRDLSDWYLGITETDVADLVNLTKKLFKIRKTLVYGFSMGGYGVWRMSFLHPELFDAAICVSGPPSPWRGDPQQNDMRNHIGKGKNLKYLVIHGTNDHAVDIKDTDDFMEKLKADGYDVEYIRVDGGGHGNFSVKKMVMKWLNEKFHR